MVHILPGRNIRVLVAGQVIHKVGVDCVIKVAWVIHILDKEGITNHYCTS